MRVSITVIDAHRGRRREREDVSIAAPPMRSDLHHHESCRVATWYRITQRRHSFGPAWRTRIASPSRSTINVSNAASSRRLRSTTASRTRRPRVSPVDPTPILSRSRHAEFTKRIPFFDRIVTSPPRPTLGEVSDEEGAAWFDSAPGAMAVVRCNCHVAVVAALANPPDRHTTNSQVFAVRDVGRIGCCTASTIAPVEVIVLSIEHRRDAQRQP